MTLHDRSGLAGTLPQHRPTARHGSAHPAPSALSISPPILAAKITSPGLPGWTAPRPRITELIVQGTRWSPLTVLTGPPGAGKTMALARRTGPGQRAVRPVVLPLAVASRMDPLLPLHR